MFQRWTLSLLCALFLSACTTPYKPPVIVKGSHDFQGLVDQLDPAAEPLDVVLVHGMCTHDEVWAYGAMDEILKAIGANFKPSRESAVTTRSTTGPEIQVIQREDTTGAGKIRFTAFVWSPLTTPLKQQLLYDMTGSPTDCATADECKPTRAKLNGKFKDSLLNDCLADALLYEGVSRPVIRRAMVSALQPVLDEGGTQRPLVLVTSSLGSKIVFDALSDMLDGASPASTQAIGKKTASRMGQVFMNANQMPLLGLADQNVSQPPLALGSSAETASTDPLRRYLAARRQQGLAALTVVAFTDPNDLLSYRLLPSRYAGENVFLADVLVSNVTTYFGQLSRPDTVHLSYSENPSVARIIACGPEKAGKNPRCK